MSGGRTPKETLEALRRMAEEDEAREEDELDRIETMSDAEVAAELKAEGIDTKAADAHAKEIHQRLHPINGAAAHTNGTRKKLTPEEVLREIERQEAEDAREAEEEIPNEPEAAKVISLPPGRRRATRIVWLVAAAIIVATAAYAARAPIVRLFSHEDEIPPSNPTNAQLADAICDRAVDACRAKNWDECATLLQGAADVHPDIRMDERYIRATWAIEQARTVDSNLPWFDKTIGPGLRPRPGTDKPTGPR